MSGSNYAEKGGAVAMGARPYRHSERKHAYESVAEIERDRTPYATFRELEQMMRVLVERVTRAHGLSAKQHAVLDALRRHRGKQPLSLDAFANREGYPASTMADLLWQLERRGLVQVTPAGRLTKLPPGAIVDHRKKYVGISAAGCAQIEEIEKTLKPLLRRVRDAMSVRKLSAVYDVYVRLRTYIHDEQKAAGQVIRPRRDTAHRAKSD